MVSVRAGVIVMLFGFAGVVLAFIEKTLYDNGVLVTALSNMGVTLAEAMALTIIVWILLGVVLGMLRS
jgi:hypothetical protein